MTIVEAVKALTEGKKIRRNDWEKGHYITLVDNQVVSERGWVSGLCIDDFSANWWEEYKEPILTDKEKTYLSAFFAPLKKQYSQFTICKLISNCNSSQKPECKDMLAVQHTDFYKTYYCKYEFIQIFFGNKVSCGVLCFPNFPKGKYYKGLELNKDYTLEELGL